MPCTSRLHLRPAIERYAVVPGRSLLHRLVESRVIVALQRLRRIIRRRHERDIGKLATTRSAQVVLRKALDNLVAILIAGTPLPAFMPRIGPRLNHTKRIGGRGSCMARTSRTDEWIDIV